MIARPDSRERLDNALRSFLDASSSGDAPRCLYQLYYEQSRPASQTGSRDAVFEFPAPSLSLAFDDGSLDAVKEAWRLVVGPDVPEADYMTFTDREGADNMDEFYD